MQAPSFQMINTKKIITAMLLFVFIIIISKIFLFTFHDASIFAKYSLKGFLISLCVQAPNEQLPWTICFNHFDSVNDLTKRMRPLLTKHQTAIETSWYINDFCPQKYKQFSSERCWVRNTRYKNI